MKRSKLERRDIDPFFNIILLCGCVGSFYLFIYFGKIAHRPKLKNKDPGPDWA